VFSWTAADSIDYLIRMSGVPRSKAEADVQRIVTYPGQAVAPEYGLLRFQWLRRSAESALGLWMNCFKFIIAASNIEFIILEQRPEFSKVNRGGAKAAPPVSLERIGIFRCNFHRLVGEPKQISSGALGVVKLQAMPAQIQNGGLQTGCN